MKTRKATATTKVTLGGRTQTIKQWAQEMGVPVAEMCSRQAAGWNAYNVVHGKPDDPTQNPAYMALLKVIRDD